MADPRIDKEEVMGRSPRHGMKKHAIWRAWKSLRDRCCNPNNPNYKYYGGRGISVCDRWLTSFENFRDDMLPSWQDGLQLDRLDNNGNYEPLNCRWTTASINMKNRSCKAKIQSKYEGISWNTKRNKWEITNIRPMFDVEEQAYAAYLQLKQLETILIGD
jgi:hypothetical protein